MDDFTRKFSIVDEKDAEIRHILTTVYRALEEKGYNPINQIVGYILSEDPTSTPAFFMAQASPTGSPFFTASS